jgi:hypothetical protein
MLRIAAGAVLLALAAGPCPAAGPDGIMVHEGDRVRPDGAPRVIALAPGPGASVVVVRGPQSLAFPVWLPVAGALNAEVCRPAMPSH